MEEEQPARRHEHRCDEADARPTEAAAKRGDEREARDRERGGQEPKPAEPGTEVRDGPGEQEVQRRAASVARHVLDDAGERVAADEEREGLVLVRRPGHQLVEQERAGRERDACDADPHPAPCDP